MDTPYGHNFHTQIMVAITVVAITTEFHVKIPIEVYEFLTRKYPRGIGKWLTRKVEEEMNQDPPFLKKLESVLERESKTKGERAKEIYERRMKIEARLEEEKKEKEAFLTELCAINSWGWITGYQGKEALASHGCTLKETEIVFERLHPKKEGD